MKRLAIISTHPIQYNAPLFRLLAHRGNIDIKVFYTWGETVLKNKYDPGFGKTIEWDIPLLEGYPYEFVENVSKNKGSHHFSGIDNPGLIGKLVEWKPDALLVFGWAFKSHLKIIRHFKGKIPVLFRGDSVSLDAKGFRKLLRKFWLRWVYRHVDVALYVGALNKAYFKENGLKDSQLVFAPHAVDNDRFEIAVENSAGEIAAWKGKLFVGDSKVVFLYAGKLDKNKNVSTLLRAFTAIKSHEAHLLIAGNGNEEAELKQMAGDNPRVHFLDFQNQSRMPILYGMCDVFVLPSHSETWGLSLNEAMACGKAVVCSSGCGAAPDLVKPGVNGFVFDAKNHLQLVQILNDFGDDKKKTAEMGMKSREMIKGNSFETICEAIESCI